MTYAAKTDVPVERSRAERLADRRSESDCVDAARELSADRARCRMKKDALPERDMFGARPHEYELPANTRPIKCASCGAAMAFVHTSNGKKMPLSLDSIETRDGVRYALPHWIDCLQAREWKENKR